MINRAEHGERAGGDTRPVTDEAPGRCQKLRKCATVQNASVRFGQPVADRLSHLATVGNARAMESVSAG